MSLTSERPKKGRTGRDAKADREPPHSVEMEMGVLGSILQSPRDAIAECVEAGLGSNWFYVPANRTIYQALRDMDDSGDPIGLITFTQYLRDRKILDPVGGVGYVTDLFAFVPTAANVAYYLDIVRDKYILRETIATCTEGVRRAFEPGADDEGEPLRLLDDVESRIASIRSLHGRNGAMQDDAAVVLETEIDLPLDVVKGVIPRGGKCSVGGASKSNKTWTLLDLAVSTATETAWLVKLETNKGRVLYVNFELQRPYFNKRIQTLCDAHQVKIDPGMLTVWHLRGRIKDWPRLQRQIRPGQFDLIILDPVYKLLLLSGSHMGVRDENSAGHIALLLDEVENLSTRTGAATVFGSHFAKGDPSVKDPIDRVSGSGVWARDPDAIINFTRLNTPECFAVDLILRNHPPVESFAVRWEFPAFVADVTLDPTDLKQRNKGAAEKQYTLAQLVELFERPMLVREICDVATKTMSRRTFFRLWDEGRTERAFLKCKDGKWKVNRKWKPAQT